MLSLAKAGYYAVALDNRGHGERKGPDFKSQVFEKDGFNLYESLKSNYRQRPDKLKFIQEKNIGHEFTASMWRNAIKWFNKHL